MPGLKRKASQPAPTESPPKLKKQSTSAAVDKGKPTVARKKEIPSTPPRLKKAKSEKSVKEKTPKKSPGKPHKLPRFPTLKPTGPISSDGPDFTFTVPSFYKKSISKPNLKKAPTLILQETSTVKKEKSVKKSLSKAPTLELAPKATEILQPEIEVEPGATRATDIEKKVQMLPSGSIFGKITNADFDEMTLPSDASLSIYEFSEESSSTSFGATPGKMTGSSPQMRASAYFVADFFSTSDGTKDFGFSDDEFMLNEETSNQTDTNKASNGVLTPMKSPRKLTGGPREIVFSFDTTGSMYNYVEEVAEKIKELVPKLQSEVPGIRLAFIAHGDYYDLKQDRYLIKWLDFGASVEETVKFFENLNITHGGDADECYELALRKVRDSLDWTSGSQRCLVMIGDSDPHEPGYKFDEFVNDIDWRVEAALLRDMGVRIYGMQVGYRSDFYRQISQITGGAHLRIDNASFTPDMLMAICLREGSLKLLKSYENEVRKAKKEAGEVGLLDLELERLFSSLKSVDDNKSSKLKMKMKLMSEKEDQKNEEPPTLTPLPVKRPSEGKSETKSGEPSPKKPGKQEKVADKKTSSEKKTKAKAEQKKVQKTKGRSKKDETIKSVAKKKVPKVSAVKKTTSLKSKVNKVSTKQSQAKKILKKTISKNVKLPKKSKEPAKKLKTKTPVKKTSLKKATPKKTTKTPDVKKKIVSKKTGVKQTPKTLASKKKTAEKVAKKKMAEKVPKQKGRQPTKDVKTKNAQKKTVKGVEKKKPVVTKDKRTTMKGKVTKVSKKTSEVKVSSKKAEAIKKVFKTASQQKETVVKKKKEPAKQSGKKELADFKLHKSPSKPVNKQPRENASVIKFAMSPLNTMFWDDWTSFIMQEKPIIKSNEWKKCPSWCPGYYNTTVYTDSDLVTGVFEIAVTPPGSKKHYSVYFNIKNLWDSF
ncbi:hypothetical protein FSP39_023015 [Pinctada imbricata]|uniref:VWFA domain-containing protein n=1 Tax=Pinctada imbricata TaxID=66713 RepID=A0AA89C7F1_PINIB|nr:hypothetical protein FSP39_023015 [Pinctada imbricata]